MNQFLKNITTVLKSKNGSILSESFHNPDLVCYPASSIKTLIAFATLQKIDLAEGSFEDELEISQLNANEECKFSDCFSSVVVPV